MIDRYIIKHEDNNEILYLFLSYDYEFASFNGKSFFKDLKKILSNKIINFKGNKIVLVVSGIIIGSIFLNNIDYKDYSNNIDNYKYINQVVLNDFNNENEFVINLNNMNNNLIDNKDINTNKDNYIEDNNNNNNNIIDNKQQDNVNKNDNNNKNNISKINNNDNNIISDINNNENKDNYVNNNIDSEDTINMDENNNNKNEYININNKENILVTIYRQNGNILDIELEEYLVGVVAGEMPASFNIEALKVQAIISRTYALKSIENNKKLTDTTSTQVYIDNEQMQKKWKNDFDKYYSKIKEAVNSTKGIIITYNNELIDAVYFANSNGYTEDAYEVWGNNIPYLKSVESPYDVDTTRYKKITTKSFDEISNILGFKIDEKVNIDIIRNNSHRVKTITINNHTYTGIEIRTLFNLNSTDFEIEILNNNFIITNYGYGHGVGVSQYGANGMANLGFNYEDIIKYYYQKVDIKSKI